MPFAQRGRVALDFAGYVASDDPGRDDRAASLNLVATVPVADRAFVEAIVPFSIVVPMGNPTLGAHYVAKVSKSFWLTGGGAFGIPLLERRGDDYVGQMIPRALWNMHHHTPDIFPLQLRFGLEFHASFFALRGQLEPSLWIPIGDDSSAWHRGDVHGAFQHAVEVQFGHEIGGGLRIQGVIDGPSLLGRQDYYQFALSPFFAITRELGFLRVGLMLPMDEVLGPPFEQSWGFLVATGLHVD